MLPNAVRSVRKVSEAVRSCQMYHRGIPEVSQFRSRGTTFLMKFYSEVSQKYPRYPRGIPPDIPVSVQRNINQYTFSFCFFRNLWLSDAVQNPEAAQRVSRGCQKLSSVVQRLSEAVGGCRKPGQPRSINF